MTEHLEGIYASLFKNKYEKDNFQISPLQKYLDGDYKWVLGEDAVATYRKIMFLLNLWFVFQNLALEPWGFPGCFIFLTMWGVHFTNLTLLSSIWATFPKTEQ